MKAAGAGLFLVLSFGPAILFTADARPGGRLCLAALPTPTAGPKTLANPTGGLADVLYSVQVDAREPIELSRSTGQWVTGLATDESHLVIIRAKTKQVASFRFRFAVAEKTELCLFLSSFYETWQVWPDDHCPWCKCEDS